MRQSSAWFALFLQAIALAACGSADPQTAHSAASDAAAGSSASVTPQAAPPPPAAAAPQASLPGCAIPACGAIAHVKVNVLATFDEAMHWEFEACRNATCFVTREDPDWQPVHNATGRYLDLLVKVPQPGISYPGFSLRSVEDSATLEVDWRADTASVRDGDRYVIRATDQRGKRHVLFDESVAYTIQLRPVPNTCIPSCPRADVDRSGATEADAGI